MTNRTRAQTPEAASEIPLPDDELERVAGGGFPVGEAVQVAGPVDVCKTPTPGGPIPIPYPFPHPSITNTPSAKTKTKP